MAEETALRKSHVWLVTSCKGGVGKSTCAVGIAAALSRYGKTVLLMDCDFGVRCLDLMLGVEDEVVYDLYDVIRRQIPAERAVMKIDGCENLYFLPAPLSGDTETLTDGDFSRLFDILQKDRTYDYILIDTPAGKLSPALLAAHRIDGGMIVASHSAASIRAAGLTGQALEENGILSQRLIINRFDFQLAADGSLPGINEIIDRTCVRLGGIVPEDRAIMRLAEEGRTSAADSNTGIAFAHIAARLEGRYVPLFDGFTGFKVRRQIKKLLGL